MTQKSLLSPGRRKAEKSEPTSRSTECLQVPVASRLPRESSRLGAWLLGARGKKKEKEIEISVAVVVAIRRFGTG